MPGTPWSQVVAVLLWAGTSFGAELQDERPRVRLSPAGAQRVLSLPPGVRGFSVRDEALMEVRLIGPRQLLLTGLREGRTELVLHDAFAPMRRIDVLLELRDVCAPFICEPCELPRGHMLQLWIRGEDPGLRGIAYTLEEARAVRLIAVRFPYFHLDVRLDRRALQPGLMRVNHALWRAGFLHARATVMDGRVQLSGRFTSEADEARARAAIAPAATELEEALLPLAEEEPVP